MGPIWKFQKFIMTYQQIQVRMLLGHGNGQKPDNDNSCVSVKGVYLTSKQGTAIIKFVFLACIPL